MRRHRPHPEPARSRLTPRHPACTPVNAWALLLAPLLAAACAATQAQMLEHAGGGWGGGWMASVQQAWASSHWQARLEQDRPLTLQPPQLGRLADDDLPAPLWPGTLRLLGDRQFDTWRLGHSGGLRLTGGLLLNPPHLHNGLVDSLDGRSRTQPYAGLGYGSAGQWTGPSLGWRLSADLGLAAHGLGAALLHRDGLGAGLEGGGWRQLRLQPLLRLGMHLDF